MDAANDIIDLLVQNIIDLSEVQNAMEKAPDYANVQTLASIELN